MTLREYLKSAAERLRKAGTESADFEARMILQQVLRLDYSSFILAGDGELSAADMVQAEKMLSERCRGIPLQYILGEWDFMGRTFSVGEGVLIPRPETEELCQAVLSRIDGKAAPVILDLCAGSGCIGITLKAERSDSEVWLLELSEKAIEYTRKNNDALLAGSAKIIHGDVLSQETLSLFPKCDVIVSNPPYIRSAELPFLQQEVQKEPKMALDGGEDGLMFYRVLVDRWTSLLKNDGLIAVECGDDQASSIAQLLSEINFHTEILQDFNGIQRIVIGRKKPDT